MGDGIRAEVSVDAAGRCPISQTASTVDGEPIAISRTSGLPGDDTVTEEFMVDDPAAAIGETVEADVEDVFSYGTQTVYRLTRDRGTGCPCEQIESLDCPIVDIHTQNDRLQLVFHAPDMDTLQSAIERLQQEFPVVDIRRLLRSDGDPRDHDLVFVDRGSLTSRQREVLETAHEMGYFEHPKGANASEVAEALAIAPATFAEHLAAAQGKLLQDILQN
ncbi:MAG: helix-turn-helix domain-containing protein [Natrialbaceae archaeon]|nr:helix-turn-helix domain-containing protein [Natrialbaceae archaeon]